MSRPFSFTWSFVACQVCHGHHACVHSARAAGRRMRSRARRWPPGSRPGPGSGRNGWRSWTGRACWKNCSPSGVIARALREAPAGHKYDRVLTAKMTVVCVLVACLFPGAGYDTRPRDGVRAARPEPQAGHGHPDRGGVLAGPQAARRAGHEAAVRARRRRRRRGPRHRPAVEGPGGHRHRRHHDGAGQATACSKTEFGTPADGARPLLRVTAHVRTATFRWIGAAIGGYHDGENALADQLEDSFGPGMLNLADRGFFSMDRCLRFSGTGAHLAWRVKNGAKSVPLRVIRTLHKEPLPARRASRLMAPGR